MSGTLAYLVTAVGCLVGVAGAVVIVVALSRSRRRPPVPTSPTAADPFRDHDADALRGDPRRLRPGDLVEIRQVTYAVRGSLHLTEGGWSWDEHLLDTADGTKRWLSVEEDPDLELVLWTAEPDATVTPGPQTVDFDGRRYRSDESGQARWTATGTTGLAPTGSVRYHDYTASGDARLSFEKYGDAGWEVARGELLRRPEVMVYPQAGPEKVG
ncbi:DUF4178 domain-containing protein [Micromonospora inyonensis]|uniref:DUF4178 domain-containing protein n=1 Tax=Micromonospora inyonensis TaxID=47866 RepID=A0A1C6RGE4_9ACTN|nr:DUF4178 domain-containing protein [Micromonospora inyonensis]SCL16156.1 protein of unknown function [Micromonospora inyonensis]